MKQAHHGLIDSRIEAKFTVPVRDAILAHA
jgi:hypothetical protein